jgi:hypothetical protein
MPHRFDRYASIIPFVVVGRKLLECHQGIDRDGHRKEKRRNEKQKKVKL